MHFERKIKGHQLTDHFQRVTSVVVTLTPCVRLNERPPICVMSQGVAQWNDGLGDSSFLQNRTRWAMVYCIGIVLKYGYLNGHIIHLSIGADLCHWIHFMEIKLE